jgi:hypothetical protein
LFPLLLSAPWWPVTKFAPDASADSWKPPDQTALNKVEALLYADRRHQWFTVGPDDVITAEA